MTIACYRFQVIDFGDPTPLQESLTPINGHIGDLGRNQCVLLHLAAGMLCNESGRSKLPPGRGRVFALTRDLRRAELEKDLHTTSALKDDSSLEIAIIRSNAHDVTNPSRDRDFRTLCFRLSSVTLDLNAG